MIQHCDYEGIEKTQFLRKVLNSNSQVLVISLCEVWTSGHLAPGQQTSVLVWGCAELKGAIQTHANI